MITNYQNANYPNAPNAYNQGNQYNQFANPYNQPNNYLNTQAQQMYPGAGTSNPQIAPYMYGNEPQLRMTQKRRVCLIAIGAVALVCLAIALTIFFIL